MLRFKQNLVRPWKKRFVDEDLIIYIGNFENIKKIVKGLISKKNSKNTELEFKKIIGNEMQNHSAFILIRTDLIVAAVDLIRSNPIFFSDKEIFTNIQSNSSNEYEFDNLIEIFLSGYSVDDRTAFREIKQLPAGSFVYQTNGKYTVSNYFRYNINKPPLYDNGLNNVKDVIDFSIEKLIKKANGRRICLSLSSGLDSRLILAKLLEHGYKDILNISYGSKRNSEAEKALNLSRKFDLDTMDLTISRKEYKDIFNSSIRKEFWNFSHNYTGIPNTQEFMPLLKLKEMNFKKEDYFFVNGQSGDFITGGHVNEEIKNSNYNEIFDYILKKHFSLWQIPHRRKNTQYLIKNYLQKYFEKYFLDSSISLWEQYESWEFHERQSKWVVHGQRVHDFFEYDYYLPLWDKAFINLYSMSPLQNKIGQKIYKDYIAKWNYQGIFNDMSSSVSHWPGKMSFVPYLARGVGIFSKEYKELIYKLFSFYGHSAERFAPYSFLNHVKICKNIRNSLSMNVETYFKENNLKGKINWIEDE